MKTMNLARHYEVLTPWERLALIAAAAGRADEVEGVRLAGSAPRLAFRVPDYFGLAEGLEKLVTKYLLGQLDLAAIYWRVMGVLDQEALPSETRRAKQREDRLWRALQTLALRFVIRADGWKLLCRQLQVDPEVFLRDQPGYETICHMEQTARLIACTPEEAVACLRDGDEREARKRGESLPGRRDYRLDSAEEVARSMRAFLEGELAEWS